MAFLPRKRASSRISGPLLGGKASWEKLRESFGKLSSTYRTPVLGGEDSLERLRASLRKPVPIQKKVQVQKKEPKKDTSIFQGKPFVPRPQIREELKKPATWIITKLPTKARVELEKRLFPLKDPRNYGQYIDPRELKKVRDDFEKFPDRSRTKYRMSRKDVFKTRALLRKWSGM